MDYNLDRRIRFEASPKFEGLYKWALQEIDDAGNVIGRDLIPWSLSLNFIADELMLTESSVVDRTHGTARTFIRAKLRPARYRWRSPSYSMLGTGRTIEEIALFITPIDPDDDPSANYASVSGHISYTSDDPLWGGIEPDYLQFDLGVSIGEFDRIAARIALRQVETATFRCQAKGFYSEWTPDVEADQFKILTSYDKEQQVAVPNGIEIIPPRLGKIWDASFSMQQSVSLTPITVDTDDQGQIIGDEQHYKPRTDRVDSSSNADNVAIYSAIHTELKTVKAFLALIAAMMLLRWFFH